MLTLAREHGVATQYCPLGYAPALEYPQYTNTVEDIDVLFFGSGFGHRLAILDALQAKGINVTFISPGYNM